MRSMQRLAGVVAGLLILGSLLACGGVQEAARKAKVSNDLKQIGLAYHSFNDVKSKGPSGPADLASVAPEAKMVIDQTGPGGPYVVIWNVKISDMAKAPGGAGSVILGYESTAPTAGGVVLFGDASVRQLTAAEFASTPKATPSSGGKK